MADPMDDDHMEGVVADVVKWPSLLECHAADCLLSGSPSMKMDNTFVASLLTGAMASFGIERKANGNGAKKPNIIDNKDTKSGIK